MFRILDLGSHDGFVSYWLATTLKERGVTDIHIDGVELNSQAVDAANTRMKELGVPGEFKQGAAEQAPHLFTPDTYDAVVLYELIEHVPSVPFILRVSELMVNDSGRIYVSTPDGTFGQGGNPHHLRCYTITDMFEILRRRGEVDQMVSAVDGLTVAAYRPRFGERRPEAAIYCGPGWEKWSPSDPVTKGLGGSETAAIYVAEALQNQGYTVTVYGECEHIAYQQTLYAHYSEFDPTEARDLLIVSRAPAMFDRPIKAHRKVLWMHDTDYGPEVTPTRVDKMDAIYVLSDWHARHVRKMYPYAHEKIIKTRNGIVPEFFETEVPRMRNRALYTSSPDRGLDFLLELWPRVRERVPHAELAFAYANVYNAVALRNPSINAFRNRVRQLEQQDGVINLGSLTQPEVAAHMRMARLWLAPSWSTPSSSRFNETFCIGALEAAAGGAVPVMSDWGALSERTEAMEYYLVRGDDDHKPNEDRWVDVIVEQFERSGNNQSMRALSMTWQQVADDLANG